MDGGRRAVRRGHRGVRPVPQAAAPAHRGRLPWRGHPRIRLPGSAALPRPAHARVRQRDQRSRDRVRSRPARPGRVRLPKAAVRDPEGGRRRLVRLAVVHALRRSGAAPPAARRVEPPPARAHRARCRQSHRLRCARASQDVRVAGLSLCQGYLAQVRDGSIVCRPGIASIQDRTVIFTDGSAETVSAIVCATGYDVDIPYLSDDVSSVIGEELALYQRTFHPDLPGLGVIGQFLAQGPYFPLLELQARWIAAVWSGDVALPGEARMRRVLAEPRPPLDPHNALALTLSEELGVAPEPAGWGDLGEPLLFGPMLPPRYRLSGPGAQPTARRLLEGQLAASPRAPVEPANLEALDGLGREASSAGLGSARA